MSSLLDVSPIQKDIRLLYQQAHTQAKRYWLVLKPFAKIANQITVQTKPHTFHTFDPILTIPFSKETQTCLSF